MQQQASGYRFPPPPPPPQRYMLHSKAGACGEWCRKHALHPDENPFSIQLRELILLHQFSIT